jgi:hypothetical protein
MRHRKVLNLYDTDQGHEDLLIYLEGIEGNTRQQQALVQMVMVGFRVIAAHESGDEAYYGVRNPDARSVRKLSAPRQAPRPRREPQVIESKAEPVSITPVQKPAFEQAQAAPQHDQAMTPAFSEQTSQEDEYNTLKILKMMDEGEN